MTPEEYAAAQAAITAGLAQYVQRVAGLFTGPALATAQWAQLLQIIYPEVERRYAEAAVLGRTFYDSQRALHHPELPVNERLLGTLEWDWFVRNMQPARKGMSQADSPGSAPTRLALAAVREVEMAGRRQIIGAVKNDDSAPQIVQGWARVATGRETCAWCLMLISRGPDYHTAESAGISLDNETVIDLFREAGQDLNEFRALTQEYIEEWHAGCDCLVVPVFDTVNWAGRPAQLRATQLWVDAGKEARRLIESGEARSTNENRETLNALRRRLERGDISMTDYALAA